MEENKQIYTNHTEKATKLLILCRKSPVPQNFLCPTLPKIPK
jgi:hypothetical protein